MLITNHPIFPKSQPTYNANVSFRIISMPPLFGQGPVLCLCTNNTKNAETLDCKWKQNYFRVDGKTSSSNSATTTSRQSIGTFHPHFNTNIRNCQSFRKTAAQQRASLNSDTIASSYSGTQGLLEPLTATASVAGCSTTPHIVLRLLTASWAVMWLLYSLPPWCYYNFAAHLETG